jgi:hypothetical protein
LITIKRHPFGTIEIPARALGIEAIQKTRSGRTALGCIAVGIGEQYALSRKRVEVRGFTLWMPAHHADPIIEVVYDDKYNIRLILRFCKRESTQYDQCECLENYIFFIHMK